MQHVTLIDKDRATLNALKDMLSEQGFRVDCHTDPTTALHAMRNKRTNLAVINMQMPRLDGISMLEKMKANDATNVPTVVLAEDSDPADEIMALRMGAEDYVHKPYAPRVLLERLRNCLRRSEEVSQKDSSARSGKTLERGPLTIDPKTMRVKWKGAEIVLTATEFELLYYLAESPDYVRSRAHLMDRLYNENICVEERVVDSHIKRIRKKIREHDPSFDAIETIYGAGYRYILDGEQKRLAAA